MTKGDNYASRVAKCFDLLDELLTKYPRSIDEVEEELVMNLEYYRDLASYIPQDKVEVKTIKCKILPATVRPPLALDLED